MRQLVNGSQGGVRRLCEALTSEESMHARAARDLDGVMTMQESRLDSADGFLKVWLASLGSSDEEASVSPQVTNIRFGSSLEGEGLDERRRALSMANKCFGGVYKAASRDEICWDLDGRLRDARGES